MTVGKDHAIAILTKMDEHSRLGRVDNIII